MQAPSALSWRVGVPLRGASKYNAKDGEYRLRHNPDIEASELNGELLLFNGATNKFFVMNPTAAFV